MGTNRVLVFYCSVFVTNRAGSRLRELRNDVLLERERLGGWAVASDGRSVATDQELGEVPLDVARMETWNEDHSTRKP